MWTLYHVSFVYAKKPGSRQRYQARYSWSVLAQSQDHALGTVKDAARSFSTSVGTWLVTDVPSGVIYNGCANPR